MTVLYEVIKGFFFFLSVIVAIFYIRGHYILADGKFTLYYNILMPGYLILMGIVIGYIIGQFLIRKNEIEDRSSIQKTHIRSLITGIIIGIVLVIMFMITK